MVFRPVPYLFSFNFDGKTPIIFSSFWRGRGFSARAYFVRLSPLCGDTPQRPGP